MPGKYDRGVVTELIHYIVKKVNRHLPVIAKDDKIHSKHTFFLTQGAAFLISVFSENLCFQFNLLCKKSRRFSRGAGIFAFHFAITGISRKEPPAETGGKMGFASLKYSLPAAG